MDQDLEKNSTTRNGLGSGEEYNYQRWTRIRRRIELVEMDQDQEKNRTTRDGLGSGEE